MNEVGIAVGDGMASIGVEVVLTVGGGEGELVDWSMGIEVGDGIGDGVGNGANGAGVGDRVGAGVGTTVVSEYEGELVDMETAG